MSDSIAHKLYAVAETVYGTTPATPALAQIRNTGTTLGLSKEGYKSEEITGSRNLQDFRHGNRQVGGDINFELSAVSFDAYLEAVLMGTWVDNALIVGSTRRSFSMVRHFTDQLEAAKPFHIFKGCEFNKLALKITPGKIITGSVGILGQDMAFAGTAPVGSTYPAVSTTKPMDAFTGSLEVDAVGVSIVTEMTLNIENGLTPDFVLFSDKTELPSIGMSNISGELGVRFINSEMLEKFLNETELALSFTLEDAAGNSYEFTLPKVILNGGQPDVSGMGPINLKMPFQAIFDSASGTSIEVARVLAV